MNEFDHAVDSYIMAIKSTETYQNFVRERDRVRQYPELKAQIDDFRKRNYELQSSPDTDFHKIDQFERDYEDFRENPLVDDFLAAELAFCRMMQKANMQVTAAIEFD
ncbi:MAG: YlbF family regulator [Acetatifactor sp.]|nr:YlbF family regulator [Acetatifactor sp.]MDE7045211.1 YlbF family regulator [Acetatifactor sp.]